MGQISQSTIVYIEYQANLLIYPIVQVFLSSCYASGIVIGTKEKICSKIERVLL